MSSSSGSCKGRPLHQCRCPPASILQALRPDLQSPQPRCIQPSLVAAPARLPAPPTPPHLPRQVALCRNALAGRRQPEVSDAGCLELWNLALYHLIPRFGFVTIPTESCSTWGASECRVCSSRRNGIRKQHAVRQPACTAAAALRPAAVRCLPHAVGGRRTASMAGLSAGVTASPPAHPPCRRWRSLGSGAAGASAERPEPRRRQVRRCRRRRWLPGRQPPDPAPPPSAR